MSRAPEGEIDAFIDRYSPEIARQLRLARAGVHQLIPKGHELVYDNYNALVFGFSPTGKPSDFVMSIAAYPKWVTLFFTNGKAIEDPDHLLEGSGAVIRGIRLAPFEIFDSRPVQALIKRALARHAQAFRKAEALSTRIQSVSAKRRPRRA